MTPRTELPRPGLPRPELSIGHPEFDAFLSAIVGADADGVELSVMSALARLGLDPWSEAARLSDLPRHAAVEALTLTLGKLPAGGWKPADDLRNLADLAHRLADCLPRNHRPVDRPVDLRAPGRQPDSRCDFLNLPRAASRPLWVSMTLRTGAGLQDSSSLSRPYSSAASSALV